jgi:hypothetical protein
MPSFYYQGSGSVVRIVGCAELGIKQNLIVRFLVGDRAFVRRKARLGKMESVTIKRINGVFPKYEGFNTAIQPDINYVDTFNRVWMEEELASQENAIDLARIYLENIRQEGLRFFEEGRCWPTPR